MNRRTLLALFASLGAVSALAIPPEAAAQTAAEAASRHALLEQAQQAAQSGNHTAAIDFAERAGRIAITPSIRYFLAHEERAAGRIADALGNAQLCVQLAQRDVSARNREDILSECRMMVSELAPRVAHVTVVTPAPAPQGLQIHVNGAPLPEALWGAAYVVNPGEVLVEAMAPGHAPFRSQVEIAAGGARNVPLELPVVESSSAPPEMVMSSSSPPPSAASPMPAVMMPPHPPSIVPFVVAGAGLVIAAVGVVLAAVVGPNAAAELNNQCGTARLCADVPRARNDLLLAQIGAYGGTTAIAVGAGVAVAGVVWAVLDRLPHEYRMMPLASRFGVSPTNGGAMLTVGGSL